MVKRRLPASLLIAMLAALCAPASPTLSAERPTIDLVTGNGYHPFTDEGLPEGGLASAIVARVFDEMGFQARFTFLPWDEGYAKTRDGHFIATFPYILKPERKQDFLYTAALFEVRPTLFWSAERRLRIFALNDLAEKTLCLPEGWAIDAYLNGLTQGGLLRVVEAPTITDCFRRLRAGTVDVLSADRRLGAVIAERVAKGPWTKNRRFSDDSNPNHLMFTRKHPQAAAWVKAFDETFARLKQEGTIYALIKAYYTQ